MIHSKIGDMACFPIIKLFHPKGSASVYVLRPSCFPIAELFHPKDIIRDKFRSMDWPFAIKLLLLKDVTRGKFGEADRLFLSDYYMMGNVLLHNSWPVMP